MDNTTSTSNGSRVNHPSHYQRLKDKLGIEAVDICEEYGFCRGNALKYILRAGMKSEEGMNIREKTKEDLEKAIWYLKREIDMLDRTIAK